MEKVNIKNHEVVKISMTIQYVIQYVHQMLTELEEDMIKEVSYLPECQANQMNECSTDSQERSFTQLNWRDLIIKNVKEDVDQDVLDTMRNLMVAECSTQRKVEQGVEANSLVIMLNILKKVKG